MKKTYQNLRTLAFLALFAGAFTLVSCSDDDPDDLIDDIINEGPSLSDGYYIVGSAVSSDTTDANLLVQGQVNGDGIGAAPQDRPGFYEGYVYMGSGSFSFIKVVDQEVTVLGGDYEETMDGDPEEITIYTGQLDEGAAEMTSPVSNALAHVSVDETTGQYVVIPVDYWEVIGSATENGWGSGVELSQVSASADEVVFEGTNVVLRSGVMKFRFNSNWSMNLEEGECDAAATACYNYFTNFGGTIAQLLHGGSDIVFDGEDGAYTVTLTYKPGKGTQTFTAKLEKSGEVEPLPEYPAELYMVGNALNMEDSDEDGTPDGWQWDLTDQQMIPVHSNPHLFWKIVWLEADGGFKFAPQRDWVGDFGRAGDATDGVYAKGFDDVPSPETSGYYMVVVNLDAETIEVTDPKVYGIGDAFGSWDAAQEANLFVVDNESQVIKFEGLPADGDLRIHVAAPTLTQAESTNAVDWWQAEFVILNDVIEYRGLGDDQERNAVSAGQNVTLNFVDGTGTVE